MQTFPCGHKVVCRKCLIKTIQVAVSQRCLPLRCVICRNRILRLQHTTASATNTALGQSSQQQNQHKQQHNSAACNIRPSSSPSPSDSLASSTVPGCATAASGLAMTPIVIRSLTDSSQDLHCSSASTVSPGIGQDYPGEYSSMPPRSVSSLSTTSASRAAREMGYITERSEFSRNSTSMQEIGLDDDLLKRVSPSPLTGTTNMEAFVFSHNDALNLQTVKPVLANSASSDCADQDCQNCVKNHQTSSIPKSSCSSKSRKVRSCFAGKRDVTSKVNSSTANVSDGGRHGGKPNGKAVFSTKAAGVSTSPAVGFLPGQTIKVHPETLTQPSGFMMTSQPSASDPSLVSNHSSPSPSRFPKSNMSASKFIAKFLPKSSRRRYSWLRHE